MAIINSTALKFYVNGVAVACATDASVTVNHSVREVLCKDTQAWREVVEGMRSWSASGSGLLAMDQTQGGFEIANLLADRDLVLVKISTEASGDKYLQGSGYFTEATINSPGAEENATYSFSFEGTGVLATGTI
jgi:predicted secreted protein